MTAIDIITRKRDGQPLSEAEIAFLVDGYTRGDIPDYQMAAFLMAVYFQDMTREETVALTRLMRDSGVTLDLSALPGPKVDKHSTGGVGDKVSLVLAPLVATCGIINPMISGRSLAHTGGTLDKLESIPGFRTQIDLETFVSHLEQRGVAMIGQTPEICPADRKIYALRDATATVQSIPLICGSILSKKLAENLDALVLDVKCGSGAIFPDPADAEKLAQALVDTASHFGLKTVAFLTQMEQPLGRNIGTWLETREAIDMLQGKAEADFYEITIALSAMMVWLGGKADDYQGARNLVERQLQTGAAFEKFRDMVQAQGGDLRVVDKPESYPKPRDEYKILAPATGYVQQVHARTLGEVCLLLGAGRRTKDDGIDYLAGIVVHKKVGEQVMQGEALATLSAGARPIEVGLAERARRAFTITPEPVAPLPLIHAMIDASGKHAWRYRRSRSSERMK